MAPGTKGQAILNGVNYASGAAGILDSSGYVLVRLLLRLLSLHKQWHQKFHLSKVWYIGKHGI